jgi:tetratricopeptide (TPR) repeat protein
MTYIYFRYGLIALFTILAIVLHTQMGIAQAWYLYAAAGLLLLSHLFLGNTWLAFNLLKRGNPQQAQTILGHTWAPDLLLKTNRAYYYFTKGLIHLQGEQLDQAKPLLEKACALKLRHNNDNALAHLNLAHINYIQKDNEKAKFHTEKAQSFQPSDLMIKQRLEEMGKRV